MLNVKGFIQTDDSRCGPACLKMVLNYYGIEATEDELCQRTGWTYALGCTDLQMKAAVESYGLKCEIHNECSWRDLRWWWEDGIPTIVDWFSPGVNIELGDMPVGHSSIVVGIDYDGSRDDHIWLMDPEFAGIRKIRKEDFMRVWLDWREDPYLQRCEDLLLRQAIIITK